MGQRTVHRGGFRRNRSHRPITLKARVPRCLRWLFFSTLDARCQFLINLNHAAEGRSIERRPSGGVGFFGEPKSGHWALTGSPQSLCAVLNQYLFVAEPGRGCRPRRVPLRRLEGVPTFDFPLPFRVFVSLFAFEGSDFRFSPKI
jgi:hypothetical protein